MEPKIKVTKQQIEALMEQCYKLNSEGKTKFRGMTYEEGVIAAMKLR